MGKISENNFKIISFMCWKWGYGAGDMAGTMRAQYPATVRPIRINCTGRVTPSLMMRAIGKGADGIIVAGWYAGECDFEIGNFIAERNVNYVREILKTMGVSPERVQMFNCSAAEGKKFQEEVSRISEEIKKIGSSPLKESKDNKESDSKKGKKNKTE